MLPFNSQTPHFLQRAKAYCAKVLPLVFDNSLSYYEFLCKMCHKLNETIDTVNAQNLNIIEFEKMVQLEMETFEKYLESRATEFENEIKTAFADFKEEITAAWTAYKEQLTAEWENEKAVNEAFRNDITAAFNSFKADINAEMTRYENEITGKFNHFKEDVNAEIVQFEAATNTNLDNFRNTMQEQQNNFEAHIVELFNSFKSDENVAREEFETRLSTLFDEWKIATLNALHTSISEWETATRERLDSQIEAIETRVRSYVENSITNINRTIVLEREARESADNNLQRQINELTPTGSIKADTADENGNSQLYTINPETSERENIYPVVNSHGGGTSYANMKYTQASTIWGNYRPDGVYKFNSSGEFRSYTSGSYALVDSFSVESGDYLAFVMPYGSSIKGISFVSHARNTVNSHITFYNYTGELPQEQAAAGSTLDFSKLTQVKDFNVTFGVLDNIRIEGQTGDNYTCLIVRFDGTNFNAKGLRIKTRFTAFNAMYDVDDTPVIIRPYFESRFEVLDTYETIHGFSPQLDEHTITFSMHIPELENDTNFTPTMLRTLVEVRANDAGAANEIARAGYTVTHYIQDGVYYFTVIRFGKVNANISAHITATVCRVNVYNVRN